MVYKRVRGWTSGRSQLPVLNFVKYPPPGQWLICVYSYMHYGYLTRQLSSCKSAVLSSFTGVVVKADETLNLSCSASSDLQLIVSRTYNRIPSLPQSVLSVLDHLSANFTHGGTYTCSATNSLKSLQVDVFIQKLAPQ